MLVVDDEPAVADAIAEQVREIGYLAVVALDAHTAIQIAASSPPDIVLTDIYMSDMDGYELIRAIRANGIPVRIIAMSGGQEGFDTLMIAEKLGADAAIGKPFRREGLGEVIARCLSLPVEAGQ